MSQEPPKRIALLVDDQEMVLKSVARVLQIGFDLVLTASTPDQAEQHLRENMVSHIVCDYDLGRDKPRGTTLINDWRGQYPRIEKAIILTGSQRSTLPPAPIGVDCILYKPCSANELLEALCVRQQGDKRWESN